MEIILAYNSCSDSPNSRSMTCLQMVRLRNQKTYLNKQQWILLSTICVIT